ncbi:MAG: hypothetical protein ACRDNS_06475 [Trebonia sp.]
MSTEYLIDAIAGDSHNIPAENPVAGYLTGDGVAWSATDWDRFTGPRIRILQRATSTEVWPQADVLDVETGALTIAQAVDIARWRAARKLKTVIYIQASRLAGARAALNRVAGIDYWVANWVLTELEARALIGGAIVAIQYASPDNTPPDHDLVPHSKLTIIQANVDLSAASSAWLASFTPAKPKPKAKVKMKRPTVRAAFNTAVSVHPKTAAGTIGATIITAAGAFAKAKGVHLTGADSTLITAAGTFLTAAITPSQRTRKA